MTKKTAKSTSTKTANAKKSKEVMLWILLLLVLGVGLFSYQFYQDIKAVKELQVDLADVSITDIRLTSTELLFDIEVTNPNDRALTVGELALLLEANDVPLTRIIIPELEIGEMETIHQELPLRLNYLDIGAVLLRALQQGEVSWRISGTYMLHLPFGITYNYAFDISRTI